MTVNSGIAQYTTPRPFDAASAQVTLHYTIEPGQDPDAVATSVEQMARRHAVAMLTAPPAPKLVPITFAAGDVQVKPVVVPQVQPVETVAGAIDYSKAAAEAAKQPWAGPTVGQKIGAIDIMGGGTPVNPTATAAAPIPTTAPTSDVASATAASPSEEVTDEAVRSQIDRKNSQLLTAQDNNIPEREKQTGRILDLLGEYVPGPRPYRIASLPQAKRPEFLARLAALS